MTATRILAIALLSGFAGTSRLVAADLSVYRGYRFGMNVSAAARIAGAKPSEARTIHQRPALIQELEWSSNGLPGSVADADPLKEGLLCFYNGELSRMVVTYDRYKVEGMSTDDIVQAISKTYGTAATPAAKVRYRSNYGDVAEVIARWEDAEYSYNLVRTGDRSSYAMVLFSKRLNELTETSITEAIRLDALDAPQRAIALEKRQAEADRVELEKARSANKPKFRP